MKTDATKEVTIANVMREDDGIAALGRGFRKVDRIDR